MGNDARYTIKEGIYIPNTQVEFSYSDGDAAEWYLLDTIRAAKDITIGSEELFRAIKDWPSKYHLSPKRADLLRPLSKKLQGKKILEIGCGCGAITRYLGELGCTVVALEGSNRRAQISKERCRDLSNVTIVNDSFRDFRWPETFDFVTLIGVLEYSNLYVKAANPFLELLEQARSFLTPEGGLLLAIENKLGLKYWAGAPEDHTGNRYDGIENRYDADTAVTFGRQELQELLERAQFTTTEFFYPFPDYKVPDIIITEKGFEEKKINIENLLVEKFDYMQGIFFINTFSTTLAAKSLLYNSLLANFSNSFLTLSYVNKPVQEIVEHPLAFIYSTVRKKKYCKETIIIDNAEGEAAVTRRYIYEDADRGYGVLKNFISDETYASGRLLFNELIPIISRTGWRIDDLKPWAFRYYTFLKTHASGSGSDLWLDGAYLDVTPFNILVQDEHTLTAFDKEWVYVEPVPLYYVFFRGLVYSFERVQYYAYPDAATPLNIIDIAVALLQQFIPFNKTHITDCKQREEKLFAEIMLGNADPFSHTAIFTRKNFELENEHLRSDLSNLNNEIEVIKTALQQMQEANQSLTIENKTLNALTQQHLQLMVQQWDEINSKINDVLHLNHLLQIELKEKETAINHMFTELKNNLNNLTLSHERNNALLADKHRLQQEIEWYKRTYENRSLLGILKEKLKKS